MSTDDGRRPRFAILGSLQVSDPAGRPVPLGGPRARDLLAVLLLHLNRTVSTDRLVDALWGETAGAGAATTLRSHVASVRRVLSAAGVDGALQTRPGGYALVLDPADLDAEVFEGLVHRGRQALATGDAAGAADLVDAALALWRGEPLHDVTAVEHAESTLARLSELRLVAQETAAAAALDLGRHLDVVGRLRPLLAEHPFRERLGGQLMVALYRSGRQVEALSVYADLRRRLDEELGLDPSPELRDLETAMLRQDPALLAPARRPGTTAGSVHRRGVSRPHSRPSWTAARCLAGRRGERRGPVTAGRLAGTARSALAAELGQAVPAVPGRPG